MGHTTRRHAVTTSAIAVVAGVMLARLPDSVRAQPATQPAPPDRMEQAPAELADVGVEEHLQAQVPPDLRFSDEYRKAVTLRQFMTGGKPVILNLGYFRCPMLCSLVLNGLVDGMKELDWTPGQEFEIVTVSIDPLETPELAMLKKQNYVKEYGRPSAASGWHFLTGKEDQIKALADAVGFRYRWDDATSQYAHAAVLVVLTPDGKVSRYLYGIEYRPQTLRLALLEASEGKIGSTMDKFLLYCFQYSESDRKYAVAATRLMRTGGVVTVLVLAAVLIPLWVRDARKKAAAIRPAAAEPGPPERDGG